MTFALTIYVAVGRDLQPGICLRHRLPQTFATASDAAAAGVEYLHQHPTAVGFEVEPPGLNAANDSAVKAQRVKRAIAARRAKQSVKGGGHASR